MRTRYICEDTEHPTYAKEVVICSGRFRQNQAVLRVAQVEYADRLRLKRRLGSTHVQRRQRSATGADGRALFSGTARQQFSACLSRWGTQTLDTVLNSGQSVVLCRSAGLCRLPPISSGNRPLEQLKASAERQPSTSTAQPPRALPYSARSLTPVRLVLQTCRIRLTHANSVHSSAALSSASGPRSLS